VPVISEQMTKAHCAGCYNDEYNRGLGGAKECWSFASAKIEPRLLIHVDQCPPYDATRAKPTPTCYRKQRYASVKPEALDAKGYWR